MSGDWKSQIFTVSDDHTSKTAGAVEYLGLDYISREPANAQFSVESQEFPVQHHLRPHKKPPPHLHRWNKFHLPLVSSATAWYNVIIY